jgi:hypothetical protein
MDSYEISEVKGPQRRKKTVGRVWNVLTVLVLVTLLCVVSVFILIFINPNSSLNPFPPSTMNPALATATATVTPRFTLVPSWTPTNAITQPSDPSTATSIPVPAQSVVESVVDIPILVVTSSAGVTDSSAFELLQGSPHAIAGKEFHPEAECNWSGVAGQATSLNGEPVRGLFVQMGGSIPGVEHMDNLIMTGMAPQYGPGGFEFTISDKLVASKGTLWIQLLDQQNLPLSNKVFFDTYDDCQKNLIIIYFIQVR